MGANRQYVIDVLLRGDDGGVTKLERSLNQIEDHVESLNGRSLGIDIHLGGDILREIREVNGQLDNLHGRELTINATGNFEQSIRNIEGQLDKITRTQELKIDVDLGRSQGEIEELREGIARLTRDISTISSINTFDIGTAMVSSLEGVTSEIGKIKNELSTLGSGGGSDVGRKLANDFYDAGAQVGNIQRQLNNLKAPQLDMNQYYGSYDQLGRLNLGAIGGSSILSMIGLGGFKSVTWANASKEQTNSVLLQRMDSAEADSPFKVSGKTYEGGTDTITHAIAQNRTVRNPDLIAQLYAFKMASGATNEQLMANVFGREDDLEWGSGSGVDVIAAFGESVALQTGSEQLGTSAMFDLAKAFGGQYASVDQYGISEDTLKRYGYDPKSEDVVGFLNAVGQIIGADAPNELMNTTEGGMTKLRKRFHRAGREIGQLFMGPVDFLSSMLIRLDTSELQIFGMKIPKGTFAKTIIGLTGLVSAIQPMQQTLKAVQDTFNRITGAVHTAVDSLSSFTETLINLGNSNKVRQFKESGAYGILKREEYARLNRQEVIEASLSEVQSTRGIHNFRDVDIENSSMTRGQKRLTRNTRAFDEFLYGLEGGMSDQTRSEIERQARNASKDQRAVRDWTQYATEHKELSKMERMGTDEYIKENLLQNWEAGRKNQINELSNWQKFRRGVRGSFNPQRDAFDKAYQNETKQHKYGGWFERQRGRIAGLRSGINALRDEGGLGKSLRNVGTAFTSLLKAINPVYYALAGLGIILGSIAGIFLIANANSEDFRNKLQVLSEKLSYLLDTVFYAVGDLFAASGLSSAGGIDGIIEVADNAVDFLIDIVNLVTDILSAMTGRDVQQSKELQPLTTDFEKQVKSILKEESQEGVGVMNANKKKYQKLLNTADKINLIDPSYLTEDKLNELGLDVETHQIKGDKLSNYLLANSWDREGSKKASVEDTYLYKTQLPALESEGIHVKEEDKAKLYEVLKNPEIAKKWNTAIADQKAHNVAATQGRDIEDSEFSRITGIQFEERPDDPIAGNTMLGSIIDPIVNLLNALKWITLAILAVVSAQKLDSFLGKVNGKLLKWSGKGAKTSKWMWNLGERLSKRGFSPIGDLLKKGAGKVAQGSGSLWKIGDRGIGTTLFEKGLPRLTKFLENGLLAGNIGKLIGEKLGGRAIAGMIPVVGQIVDLLWIAWDLTGLIGDALDMNIPWLGDLFTIISPLRTIQKNWNYIIDAANNFGQAITDALSSVGLGWLADELQSLWDKMVGFYEWLRSIPIVGWLLPDLSKTTNGYSGKATPEEESDETTTGMSVMNKGGSNAINPSLNSSAPNSFAFANSSQNTIPSSVNGTSILNKGNGNTVNNNIHIEGFENGNDFAKMVIRVINENMLWDAQKAGRVVDGKPNI